MSSRINLLKLSDITMGCKERPTAGRRTSLMLRCAVKVPSMTLRGVRWHQYHYVLTFPSISFPTICLLFTSPSPYTDTPIIAIHVHCGRSILSPDYRQIIDSKRTYWVYADKSKPTSHCWRRQPSIDYIFQFLCCLCRRKYSDSREGTIHLFSNLPRKQAYS